MQDTIGILSKRSVHHEPRAPHPSIYPFTYSPDVARMAMRNLVNSCRCPLFSIWFLVHFAPNVASRLVSPVCTPLRILSSQQLGKGQEAIPP